MLLSWNHFHSYCTGSASPFNPSASLEAANATSANISWLVRLIAYTPENYSVLYGYSSDSLTFRSIIIEGTRNITASFQLYAATLSSLQPFTQYYYAVEAQNRFAVSLSDIHTFRTAEAGKWSVVVVH